MFIQAQCLPWQQGLYAPGRDDVDVKILSIDEQGTDSTCLLRYPPGWERQSAEHLSAHEEIFVLRGSVTINGLVYGPHCYGFFPAGFVRESASSSDGAIVLTMFYDLPETTPGSPPEGLYDERLLVPHIDSMALEWDPGLVDPQLSAGVAIKPLREDPDTGEVSFLYCSPPHRVPPDMAKPQWTHPMVEELYCIDGDYVWGDCGRMGPGGYAWWREDIYHGPSGTDTGYHLFVRTVNGPLVNIFDDEKKPFTWTPEYKPQLPPELEQYALPYQQPDNF
jgi:hypothetical protein